MKAVFAASSALESDFCSRGYATLDFMSKLELERLKERVTEILGTSDRSNVYQPYPCPISALNRSSALRARLFTAVAESTRNCLERLLDDYEVLHVNTFEKPAGITESEIRCHQHPTLTEDPTLKTLTFWIPLCDVNKRNGTVGVIPFSNDKFYQLRAWNMPDVYSHIEREIATLGEPICLTQGQALAIDDSTLHFSYPNLSNESRTALMVVCGPKKASYVYNYYRADGARRIEQYSFHKEYLCENYLYGEPKGLELLGSFPYEYHNISPGELIRQCRHSTLPT